jgi:quinol monooxygenase YgiN
MTFRNVVIIRHKVANYRKWRAVFDAHGPARAVQGCQGVHVFRRADNPKELLVMLAWSDLGKARQFMVSEDLREMLAQAPVSDRPPDVYLLEELDQARRAPSPDRRRSALGEPSGAGGGRAVMSSPPTRHESSEGTALATPAGSPDRILARRPSGA